MNLFRDYLTEREQAHRRMMLAETTDPFKRLEHLLALRPHHRPDEKEETSLLLKRFEGQETEGRVGQRVEFGDMTINMTWDGHILRIAKTQVEEERQ